MGSSTKESNRSSGDPAGFQGADREVDARGLLCPEPLVRCRQAFHGLEPGGTVHVIATDPHAEIDFEVFTRRTAHEMTRSAWLDGEFHVLIRKA